MILFRNIKGHIKDPLKHTLDIIQNYPYVEIHIGSDSQNLGKKTSYATVIAYRLGTRGVHYILNKSNVPV
jgi:predicted RNase H-related nuclease YkuK (DUF458 family)